MKRKISAFFIHKNLCPLVFFVFVLVTAMTAAQSAIDPRQFTQDLLANSPTQTREGEILLDPHIVSGTDTSEQWSAAVAFDGTNYLVVWEEQRADIYTDIYGARVTRTGILIDTSEIAISTAPYSQRTPAVTFNGTDYLVVWQDFSSVPLDPNIVGTRVSPDGIVLDPLGIVISDAPKRQAEPVVASDGSGFLVVWQDLRDTSYDIYGARVTGEGVVLDTAGIAVSTTIRCQANPAIAFDGTNYMVVWQHSRGTIDSFKICGTRVNQAGVVLDTAGIIIATGCNLILWKPCIAFDGINYLAVWQEENDNIACTRIDQTGHAIGSVFQIVNNSFIKTPVVAYNGFNYLVTWQQAERPHHAMFVTGVLVSPSGTLLDTVFGISCLAEPNEESPALASDGINFIAVWDDYRNGYDGDIYGAIISPSGIVVSNTGISTVPDYQWSPAVAFDGTNYLAVWDDDRSGAPDIYGARLSPDGTVLDPLPIAVSTAPDYQISPAAAFDGTNYLVVWEDYRGDSSDIFGARVDQAGNVLDPDGIPIAIDQALKGSPSVAFGTSEHLVVWQQLDNYDFPAYNIKGALVDQNGVVSDTVRISMCPIYDWDEIHPSVCFDGTNFLVAWEYEYGPGYRDIYAARVTQNAILLDTASIFVFTFAFSPSIAFDGVNYLVTASDWLRICGVRINQSGQVIDTSGIWIGDAWGEGFPSVAFDGTNYLTAWQFITFYQNNSDIYGSRLSPQGVLIDTFTISNPSYDQRCPAVCHGSGNQLLIAYSGWCDSIDGSMANTMRIWGKIYPFTGIDQDGSGPLGMKPRIRAYPNPFTDAINIECRIPASELCVRGAEKDAQKIHLRIYDAAGQLVKIFHLDHSAPVSRIAWHGDDFAGRRVSSGVYFCCIEAGNSSITKKILLVR